MCCSIGFGAHGELLEIARPALIAWATRFGWDLDLRTELLALDRPPAWSKIMLLTELIDIHKIVLWVDADAIVVDGPNNLSAYVNCRRPIAIVAHAYAGQRIPNTAIIALQSYSTTRWLLDCLWTITD